jgi:glycosyltransferase involved in cell wall biosynthesis
VQVSSRQELEEFRRLGFATPEPFLLSHGIDLPPREVSGDPPPPPPGMRGRVVFLGRVNWEKGLDRLVPAMRLVPETELVIAGNDEEEYAARLKELAREAGVADRLRFTGPVDQESKWELLSGAALVVLPSYSESFGMAALEAMAVARPVVVTPEVGLAGIVRDADSGIVVDGAPEKLGPAIDLLIDQPDRRKSMGDNGRRRIEEQLTWDSIALQMQRWYEEITRRP